VWLQCRVRLLMIEEDLDWCPLRYPYGVGC